VSKLSEKKRLLLTIATSVLITGGLVALIMNDRSEIEGLQSEIGDLDQRISLADVEIRKTSDREERVVVFRAVEEKELDILPSEQKIAEFYHGLSKFFVAAGLRFRELPESQPVESDLAKGIYVTRSVVEGQGDSGAILKFLNMLENDPRLVSIKGLKIEAADPRDGKDTTDGPMLHEVVVHLESYYYSPAGTQQNHVVVQGEEQRLEQPSVKEAISAFVPERPATYDLKLAASRRDPLVDPRERRLKVDEGVAAADLERQEAVVVEVEAGLADLLEMDEQVRALLAAGELFKADRLQGELDVKVNELRVRLQQVQQMKSVTNAGLMNRVLVVQQRVDELMGRRVPRETVVTRSLAEKTLTDARAHLERGAFSDVATLCQAWFEFLRGKQIHADAQSVIEDLGALRVRARVLAETEGLALVVTGTLVHEAQPERSIAVVNGVHIKLGEAVDVAGEVRVHAVRRDAVDFAYKGEIFTRSRGAANATPAKGTKPPAKGAAPKAPAGRAAAAPVKPGVER
jgi:hypothetical protein